MKEKGKPVVDLEASLLDYLESEGRRSDELLVRLVKAIESIDVRLGHIEELMRK